MNTTTKDTTMKDTTRTEAERLRDATRMAGSLCYGCGEGGTKRSKVTQQDLGSPVKWHRSCYRRAQAGGVQR